MTHDPDKDPLAPHVEILIYLILTAGTIAALWGAWELMQAVWEMAHGG